MEPTRVRLTIPDSVDPTVLMGPRRLAAAAGRGLVRRLHGHRQGHAGHDHRPNTGGRARDLGLLPPDLDGRGGRGAHHRRRQPAGGPGAARGRGPGLRTRRDPPHLSRATRAAQDRGPGEVRRLDEGQPHDLWAGPRRNGQDLPRHGHGGRRPAPARGGQDRAHASGGGGGGVAGIPPGHAPGEGRPLRAASTTPSSTSPTPSAGPRS